MYRGFNLRLSSTNFTADKLVSDGRSIFDEHRRLAKQGLDSFKDAHGNLLADKVMADWFPNLRPHVFISHSHKDGQQALGLAGWLKNRFGLNAFVDSCAWGYGDVLLKALDKEYCWQDDEQTYNYDRRNRSTTHVHLMLTNALLRLIDSSECILFVNTPNAISPQAFIQSGGTTNSPWIYSEMMLTQLIQRRSPRAHRTEQRLIKSGMTHDSAMESLQVQYPVNTRHLTDLSYVELKEWDRRVPTIPADQATTLDVLYSYKP